LLNFRVRDLRDIAADGNMHAPDSRVHRVHSVPRARVNLPPLAIGAPYFARLQVSEHPGGSSFRSDGYVTEAPSVFVVRDAVVQSSAGVVRVGSDVVRQSLAHTDPGRAGYARIGADGIALRAAPPVHLAGTYVSLLAGNAHNYFHALIDSIMRLAIVPDMVLGAADAVLLPANAAGQEAFARLMDLPARVCRVVGDDETFLVDRLVLPESMHGLHGETRFHPRVAAGFERMSAQVAGGGDAMPKRIYIDRRGARLRPLLNEGDVVTRLGALGFVPVRLESLGVADQIRLFRGADAIVAPHGAGLANLGFCRPGCVVLELFMDAYVNWCFRHISAVRALRYDCVVGQSIDPWIDRPVNMHALRWLVSPDEVVEAASCVLAQASA